MKRKKVLATLKVLGNVLEQLTKDVSAEEAERLIPEEVRYIFFAVLIVFMHNFLLGWVLGFFNFKNYYSYFMFLGI